MPYAYPYLRCSHEEQKLKGLTIQAQLDMINNYCRDILFPRFPDVAAGPVFKDEAVSAYKQSLRERKGGALLNEALRRGDHVIFAVTDRGFRNIRDFLNTSHDWHERGIVMHYLDMQMDTANPMVQAMLAVRIIFAQLESSFKSQRMHARNAYARKSGAPVGRPPLGFKIVGKKPNRRLARSDIERAIMGACYELHRNGVGYDTIGTKYLSKIMARLKPQNWRNERLYQKGWSVGSISYLIANEKKLRAEEAERIKRAALLPSADSNGTAGTQDACNHGKTLVYPSTSLIVPAAELQALNTCPLESPIQSAAAPLSGVLSPDGIARP